MDFLEEKKIHGGMKSKAREPERALDKKVNLYYLAAREASTRSLICFCNLLGLSGHSGALVIDCNWPQECL